MPANYDFCGWATRNDIQCSDGRTIRKDAFKDNDGMTVPLVWNHQHNEPYNVLGHALLENRDEGVYAYGYFNGTESGKNAKELLRNGDIHYMSIYANRLKQAGGNVLHGMIREVSLVLAGANPGANIEAVMVHADGFEDEEDLLIVNQQDQISLAHADEPEEKKPEEDKKEEPETEKKPEAEEAKAEEKKPEEEEKPEKEDPDPKADEKKPEAEAAKEDETNSEDKPADEDKPDEGEVSHADNDEEALAMADGATKEKTVQDVFDEFTDEQKNVVYALIGAALEQAKDGGNGEMKQNAFENGQNGAPEQEVLTHAEMQEIMQDAQELGSLKKAVLQHGITNIDLLFPDYKNYTDKPGFIDRPQGWVKDVMGSVGKTPFTRVKSMFADITGDEARARGYVKGNQKVDEVFALLKRETSPQTIYKKQSLDRDDVIDITDFDVVAWLRQEMRGKLDEEIARAILVGDGRSPSSSDKIKEANIRPIWTDDPDLFTVRANVPASDNMPKSFIRTAVKARKDYKGSGNPVLYCSEEWLTECLLLEDSIGRPLYDSEAKLATAMRVSKIVSVPVMENLTRTDELGTHKLMGIIVNLKDYNIGCDKGGQVSMFDDFDIDYNKQKYLIETRISGALVVPFSAIILEQLVESNPG